MANFTDALKKTAKKTVKKTNKKTMPVLDAPVLIKEEVDNFIKAKSDKKMAEGVMEFSGGEIIEYAKRKQDADGFGGMFRKSYAIEGITSGNKVSFITSNRFSINPDDSEVIEELLGDKFENMIEVKHDVRLKAEVFTNEKLQEKLMGMIGEDFDEFFDTVTTLAVKEDFDKMAYTAVNEEGLGKLRTFVKPSKPTIR